MARWLMEETDHELVDWPFTGITWPRLERAVQRQVMLGMKQVVVLPYYLFTGTLMQRIAARWITCASSTRRCGLPSLRTSGLKRNFACWSSAWPTCARRARRCCPATAARPIPRDCPRPGPRAQPRTYPCRQHRLQAVVHVGLYSHAATAV